MEQAAELLRSAKVRTTTHRIAVVHELMRAKKPLTAEELRTRVKSADLVTIYRALEQFNKAGIAHAVRLKDGVVRFEISHGHHHHHLVCTRCGEIDELPDCDVRSLEKNALASATRFASIEEHALEFFGTCTTCARR